MRIFEAYIRNLLEGGQGPHLDPDTRHSNARKSHVNFNL